MTALDQVNIPDRMRLAIEHERAVTKRNQDRAATARLGASLGLRKAVIIDRDGAARTVTIRIGASDLSDVPADPIADVPVLPGVYARVNDAVWVGMFPTPLVMFTEGVPGRCKLRRSGTFTVASGGTEPGAFIDFDTEVEDNDNLHDNVTFPHRITFGWPGWWDFWGGIDWEPTATAGFRSCAVRRNNPSGTGLKVLERQRGYQGHAAIQHGQNVPGGRTFAAGEWIELMAWQNSGVSITLAVNDEDSPVLGASWKG
jgi:hypothetical protein